MNKTNLTLEIGKTDLLVISGTSQKVSWATSNGNIANVNQSGLITAISTGNCTISALVNNMILNCNVTITAPVVIENPVLNKTKLTLEIGQTDSLVVSGTSQKISWTTSNSNIANVNQNGVVTAISAGNCVISALVNNTILNCNVTITAPVVIENPVLNKTNLTLEIGQTDALIVSGTSKNVEWTTSNDNIVTVNQNGLITAISGGNAVISVQIGDIYLYCDVIVNKIVNWIEQERVEPTCIENGYIIYKDEYSEDTKTETIPATGHKWDEGVITTQPTCTKDGIKTYTCTICGETYTEIIPASGHVPGDWVITTEPSSGASTSTGDFGIREQYCTVCGEKLDEQTIINIDLGNGETQTLYGNFDDDMAKETFNLTNEYRSSLGLSELEWFDPFEDIAKIRSVEIDYKPLHTKPNGENVKYINDNGDVIGLGENLASGPSLESDEIVFNYWINSNGHANNIKNQNYTKYSASCFISYDSDGNYYYNWIQLFR